MSFGRQKRLLLGWLAFLAPLPLPFNGVVGWPSVALYLLGTVLFLRRANLDPPRWLPLWGMNVLGVAYLPLFLFDLLVFSAGRLVASVIHLCLFAVLVKLFSLTRERDKWQASMGIFFLFLAAMGTSVHPTIVLYLIVFLTLVLLLFTRFAFLHVLSSFGRDDPALARIPLRGFLAFSTGVSVLLAVPLFLFLPRVRSPFILGGKGTGTVIEAAGFSDEVTLDSIGLIRESRQVAMRMIEEGGGNPNREMRFKAATYDVYQGRSWRRAPERDRLRLRSGQGVRFQIARQAPVGWAKIWLQPLRSASLPLPVEAVLVEPRATALSVDQGGAVSLGFSPLEVMEYRVGMAFQPVLTGSVPSGPDDGSLDLSGVTPRIQALAGQVMGQGTAAQRVRRLQDHLLNDYGYTLDFQGRSGDNPIEEFLFRYKSGQCEYFASSMVLMLRSQGIHARLVTGFLGGEYNPFEGYFVVRDSNAHAWVEAYLPGEGWRLFDPTPPAGRPADSASGLTGLLRQAWDFLVFRWDRYVLTFGLYDQLRIFGGLRELWRDFWGIFSRDKAADPASPSATLDDILQEDGEPSETPGLPQVPLSGALALTAMAVITWMLYLRFRPPLTATAAYRQLRHRLGRSGARLPESAPPLAVREEAEARYPAAAAPAARVIDFYLRESFGGQELKDGEREELKAALQEAEKKMRKAG